MYNSDLQLDHKKEEPHICCLAKQQDNAKNSTSMINMCRHVQI